MSEAKISEAHKLAYETGMYYSQNEKCQPGVPFYAFTQGELDRFVERLTNLHPEPAELAEQQGDALAAFNECLTPALRVPETAAYRIAVLAAVQAATGKQRVGAPLAAPCEGEWSKGWNACREAVLRGDVACGTCNGWGLIGGPSFYAPDEGGAPCPDFSSRAQVGEVQGDARSQFEAWQERFFTFPLDLTKNSFGSYELGVTSEKYATWLAGWKAALAATGKQQVGEVQGDALAMIGSNLRSILDLASKMGGGSYQITVANIQHETNHALQLLEAALAARQPGAVE